MLISLQDPFSKHRQPIFHDPYGAGGYLSFRGLTPFQLAVELRPYILQFRHSLYLLDTRTASSSAPPLPHYCRHIALDRRPTPGQSIAELSSNCLSGLDVTGFYLLCELLWRLIAENRSLFELDTQARPILGPLTTRAPASLRTKFDAVS